VPVEFASLGVVDALYDLGLIQGLIPMVAVAGSRWWPYALLLPVTLLPIAGKTVRQLVYQEHWMQPVEGWLLLAVVPLGVSIATAFWASQTREEEWGARRMLGLLLAFAATIYGGLNFTYFHLPWPWLAWTYRTPSAITFAVCEIFLLWIALRAAAGREERGQRD